jgi:hypothetical protein
MSLGNRGLGERVYSQGLLEKQGLLDPGPLLALFFFHGARDNKEEVFMGGALTASHGSCAPAASACPAETRRPSASAAPE